MKTKRHFNKMWDDQYTICTLQNTIKREQKRIEAAGDVGKESTLLNLDPNPPS